MNLKFYKLNISKHLISQVIIFMLIIMLSICYTISNISGLENLSYERKKFIDRCFADETIVFEGNNEITEEFTEEYKSLYEQQDYERLDKIISTNNYTFIYYLSNESIGLPETRLGLEWTWNSFFVENNYRGEPNTVIYKCEVRYHAGYGAYYEHKKNVTVDISYKGNISKAGTKSSKTPVVDLSKNPDRVIYDFGIYIRHTDGTYFEPPHRFEVTVFCAPRREQPDIRMYN